MRNDCMDSSVRPAKDLRVRISGDKGRVTVSEHPSGTMFEATKLPRSIWFLALHQLNSANTSLSSL